MDFIATETKGTSRTFKHKTYLQHTKNLFGNTRTTQINPVFRQHLENSSNINCLQLISGHYFHWWCFSPQGKKFRKERNPHFSTPSFPHGLKNFIKILLSYNRGTFSFHVLMNWSYLAGTCCAFPGFCTAWKSVSVY